METQFSYNQPRQHTQIIWKSKLFRDQACSITYPCVSRSHRFPTTVNPGLKYYSSGTYLAMQQQTNGYDGPMTMSRAQGWCKLQISWTQHLVHRTSGTQHRRRTAPAHTQDQLNPSRRKRHGAVEKKLFAMGPASGSCTGWK
jgi:hypothetical protein